MTEHEYEYYTVTFVGDYFTCTVPVKQEYASTEDSDVIVACADEYFQDVYGWSPLDYATISVEVEHD